MSCWGRVLALLGLLACCAAVGADDRGRGAERERCEMARWRPQLALWLSRPAASGLLSDGLSVLPGRLRDRVIRRQLVPRLDEVVRAFEREPHVAHARDAGPDLLRLIDRLHGAAPGNPDLLLLRARANGLYAFALLDEENPAEAVRLYGEGRRSGCTLLESASVLGAPLPTDPRDLRRRLEKADRRDVPALSWAAFSWCLECYHRRGEAEALAEQPRVEAVLDRVVELDEGYYRALPHTLSGFLFGSRTAAVGGDPERARRHFERALELTGRRYLLIHLLYANSVAVQTQDRKLFLDLLQEVLDAPRGLDPEHALANQVARERAERLLARADDLILPADDAGGED